jgi:predicted translin family RNA/ssDNA-binding protein
MNKTNLMTITERNQKLYDLRKKLDQKRMELAWIETEIMAVNSEYDRQNRNIFEEMFGG